MPEIHSMVWKSFSFHSVFRCNSDFFYKPDLTIYTYYLSRTHCYRNSQFFSPVFSLSLLYFAILVFMGFCKNKSFWLTWCTEKKECEPNAKKVTKATFYVRCSTDKHNRRGNFFFFHFKHDFVAISIWSLEILDYCILFGRVWVWVWGWV